MFSYCSKNILFIILTIGLSAGAIFGQTSGFTYQGRLTDGGTPANGNYDLQFVLFDAADGNNQIGQPQTIPNVPVSGGVFTVTLDFGANAFPGASRFLEISMRPSGTAVFTPLTPRQPITSTPYAVRSLNAAAADVATNAQQLGGAAAAQYVKTDDSRLSDPRPPTTGSASYIQNTLTQQISSNFNISGNGTVGGTLSGNIVNAGTQYNIGGRSVLFQNGLYLQIGSGISEAVFPSNVGVGTYPTTPNPWDARMLEITGKAAVLRLSTTSPSYETWDWQAKSSGYLALLTGPSWNRFDAMTIEPLGRIGIYQTAPAARLHITDPGNALRVETLSPGGTVASFGGNGAFRIDLGSQVGGRLTITEAGYFGVGTPNPITKFDVDGGIRFTALATGGTTQLCRNGSTLLIASCSSSMRYKTDPHRFTRGLDLINLLHPITFKWKADLSLDLGLSAEDVAVVEPLLVTHNADGEVEGVKYDRLNVVLVNAIKEQQAQIKSQETKIKSQDDALAALQTRLASLERTLRKPRHHVKRRHVTNRT